MPAAMATDEAQGPLVKRQKLSNGNSRSAASPPRQSRIFTPFRTVGLVSSTKVPFTSIPLGKTTFQITTSVGKCLQTYDLKRGLNLVFLTRPQIPQEITASLAWKDKLLAAWGGMEGTRPGIWVFKRGKLLEELPIPDDLTQEIRQILIFGSWIIGCCATRIEVWKSVTYEHYTTLHTTANSEGGNELTAICNMPTYLNKIFAGRRDGGVDIWNVSTGKLVYTILPPANDCGAVTAMQPTPALSLLAIAYSEGPLIVHDIHLDKTVILLHSDLPITSISFRSDGQGAGEDGRKDGVMSTAGLESGDITFWDLNNGGRVMGVLRGAHNPPAAAGATVGGGVNKAEFLPGQPVIVTSGMDNSLKSWIFDEAPFSAIPRILHSRSGHAAPVTRLQFLPVGADGADTTGKWLLSAAKDRSLWGWSLRRDGQSTELSQGNIRKKAKKLGILNASLVNEPSITLDDLKAPEITCIASSLNRDGGIGAFSAGGAVWQKGHSAQKKATDATQSGMTGWESVVTGHRGDKYARTWFWGRKKAGRWALETGDGNNVSSVGISPCGTFAVVGSEGGGIDMYNLQSGIHRRRFPSKLTPAQDKQRRLRQLNEESGLVVSDSKTKFQPGLGKHTKEVTGLVVDSLNQTIISCSLDGKVKFWDFSTGNLVDEINWSPMSAITGLRYHPASDLIALTCDDLSIRVVDIVTKKTVRELWGCQGGINDYCFSNDGRWIVAAAKDRIIRVWDLPTGHLIDAIRTVQPCTALAFSNTGEFLATACDGEIGVDVWNNKSLFSHVPTRQISESEIADIEGPTASGEGGQGIVDGAFEDEEDAAADATPMKLLDQLNQEMMTLSMVPKSKWQTLLHLDLIKQRNKPKEAPKAPEKAPFFLPSLEMPEALALSTPEKARDNTSDQSRIMKMDRFASEGRFTLTLREGHETGEYNPFITHFKTLSPSAADLEIRSLSPSSPSISGNINELSSFVHALTNRLSQKRDYELIQAWMTVFLRLHADAVVVDEELRESLREWRDEAEKEGKRLGDLMGYCAGVSGFLRAPRS